MAIAGLPAAEKLAAGQRKYGGSWRKRGPAVFMLAQNEMGIMEQESRLPHGIKVNLSAAEPSAVMVVWVVAFAALGIFGDRPFADRVMSALIIAGGAILSTLAIKA